MTVVNGTGKGSSGSQYVVKVLRAFGRTEAATLERSPLDRETFCGPPVVEPAEQCHVHWQGSGRNTHNYRGPGSCCSSRDFRWVQHAQTGA